MKLHMNSRKSSNIMFVDDQHILYRSGTRRSLCPATRFAHNPIIWPTFPWEVAIGWTSVYHNPDLGQYQMWYQAYANVSKESETPDTLVCYAESSDGYEWKKPMLNLFAFEGVGETNIVMVGSGGHSIRYGNSVVVDPNESDCTRRYKMGFFDFIVDSSGVERPGLAVAFSHDGIHWSKYPEGPRLPANYCEHGEDVPITGETENGLDYRVPLSMSDAVDIFWDPLRKLWAWYGKSWIDGPDGRMAWKHGMARTESRNFIDWSQPNLLMVPDDSDPEHLEFHSAPVFYCDGMYFCLNQLLDRSTRGGVIDIELAVSHDGTNFCRPFRDQFFLPRNSELKAFDAGSILTNASPVILDKEIRFYYGGYDQGATGSDDANLVSGVGMASIPRGRFAGISPVDESSQTTLRDPLKKIGQITLKPINFSNVSSLSLNADSGKGVVRVEILTRFGIRIKGFTLADAVPIVGDSLEHSIEWHNKRIDELEAGEFILRIHMDNATVFGLNLVYI